MTEYGFYIVSDQFFEDFQDKYLKGNKEENRPHYFAIQDKKTGLYWFVPMSSRTNKYKKIIEGRERRNKPCDILHIAKLDNGKESVLCHPNKNGHRKASKNGMNRSISFVFERRPHLFHGSLDNEPLPT